MSSALTIRSADPALAAKLRGEGVAPLLARVLSARRDISRRSDIAPALQHLPRPAALAGLPALAGGLADAVQGRQPVCVVGDYDADGVTAAVLAVSALKKMGAEVSLIIPERPDGYGLSPEIAERAAAQARALLTVDNGAAAVAGVRRARELGMTVCVTDHHLPPPESAEQPPAHFCANPKSAAAPWPAANLSGVGVAFYAMAALRAELFRRGALAAPPNLAEFLDLVAVGTVADCVPMDAVNRSLTAQGLARLRAGRGCPGLRAILRTAGRRAENLNARDLSHALGPRINAAGRLDNAQVAARCLLADNDGEAEAAAAELEECNTERVRLLRRDSAAAAARVPRPPPAGLVLHDSAWRAGIIGIVAARVSEEFSRPAVIFADDGAGQVKGSGRAVNGFNLHRALARAQALRPELPFEFGGHAVAVGVKMRAADLPEFAAVFARACAEDEAAATAAPPLEVDEAPPPAEITVRAAAQVNRVIWGKEFPTPKFAGEFAVKSENALPGGHARMTLEADGRRFPAVRFFAEPSGAARLAVVYQVGLSLSGGAPQLVVERTL